MRKYRLICADEFYDTLADELTWLMKYGDDVYLEVGECIREAINKQTASLCSIQIPYSDTCTNARKNGY